MTVETSFWHEIFPQNSVRRSAFPTAIFFRVTPKNVFMSSPLTALNRANFNVIVTLIIDKNSLAPLQLIRRCAYFVVNIVANPWAESSFNQLVVLKIFIATLSVLPPAFSFTSIARILAFSLCTAGA